VKGVILAGGSGSRLDPMTRVTNKHLLPVYDRPMIYFPLRTIKGMGVREVMIILGGRSIGDIVDLLGDGSEFGLDLTYRFQREPLGIAHAVGLARDFVGSDSFCVVLGDNILRGPELMDVAKEFVEGDYGAGCLLFQVPDPRRFGVAEFNNQGIVVAFEEKPTSPKSDFIPIGVYFLRPESFDVISRLRPSGRGELEITDVLNHYAREGSLLASTYSGSWSDAGTVESLAVASEMVGGANS
jgi:glucose-1-phosphate thymidylyltransferase